MALSWVKCRTPAECNALYHWCQIVLWGSVFALYHCTVTISVYAAMNDISDCTVRLCICMLSLMWDLLLTGRWLSEAKHANITLCVVLGIESRLRYFHHISIIIGVDITSECNHFYECYYMSGKHSAWCTFIFVYWDILCIKASHVLRRSVLVTCILILILSGKYRVSLWWLFCSYDSLGHSYCVL